MIFLRSAAAQLSNARTQPPSVDIAVVTEELIRADRKTSCFRRMYIGHLKDHRFPLPTCCPNIAQAYVPIRPNASGLVALEGASVLPGQR